MSETLKRLGINIDYFPKELEQDAVEQLTSLRMEQILQGEPQKFNWDNLLTRPELVELNDDKKKNSQFQQDLIYDEDEDGEWIYADNSLYLFSKKSPFRKNIIKVLKQPHLIWITRAFTIANIVAFCLYDYSIRRTEESENMNRVADGMEILCNIYFQFEMCLQIVAMGFVNGKGSYLRNGWNFLNLVSFFATWSVLYDITADTVFLNILRTARLVRCARLVQDFPVLKTQMVAFVNSFPKLGAIIIPLLFVLFYYSIVGIHIFMGVTEKRCRFTKEPDPITGYWPADLTIKNLCGVWQCPEDRYCGDPSDYDLPRDLTESNYEAFSFNLNRFDSIFYAIFVVFTFLNVTGWSGTTFFYWKAVNTYLTGFYFITLIFLLAYILSNLLLATFYESFMVQSSIKQSNKAKQEEEELENEIQKKRQQQMVERLAAMGDTNGATMKSRSRLQTKISLYFSPDEQQNTEERENRGKSTRLTVQISKSIYFVILNTIMTVICTIEICMDYHGIKRSEWEKLQIIDFICMVYFFVEVSINLWGKGFKVYFKKYINVFDTMVILTQVILCFYCFIEYQPLVINDNRGIEFWKSLKILKMLKVLYSAKMFHTISVLIRCLFDTLITIKYMILLFITLALTAALFGREMFAEKVRWVGGPDGYVDLKEGTSYPINYDNLGHALVAAFNMFYNEEWHMCMYVYTKTVEVASIVFFVFWIVMGQVFFVRLLMAVFLNEFCKTLTHTDTQLKPFYQNKQVKAIWETVKSLFAPAAIKLDNSGKKAGDQDNKFIDSASPNQPIKLEPVKLQEQFNLVADNQKVQQLIGHASNDEEANQLVNRQHVSSNPNIVSPLNEDQVLNEDEDNNVNKNVGNPQENTLSRHSKHQLGSSALQLKIGMMVDSTFFQVFKLLLNLLTAVRIAAKTPLVDPNSVQAKFSDNVFIALTIIYAINMLLTMFAKGLYRNEESYFRASPVNVLLFFINIFEILTLIFDIDHPLARVFNSLRLLQFIQIGSQLSQGIRYAQIALLNSLTKMINLALFCLMIFVVYGAFATKLLKGALYYCAALDSSISISSIVTNLDCLDHGGSWVNQILSYDDIFQSICILFVTSTTEAWLPILQYTQSSVGVNLQPIDGYNRWWSIYFQLFFFIGFICMLNMFIGLIVNTYQEGKSKAQSLHLLDDTQREFFLIKKSIYLMKPLTKSQPPAMAFRQVLFRVTKHKQLKRFFILVIVINIITLAMYFHRQDPVFREVIDSINIACIIIFAIEIIIRLLGKEMKTYVGDFSNCVDAILIIPCIVNLSFRNDLSYEFQFRRFFNAVCVAYQLLRGYRIVKRFNPVEKLFASIFSVIPSALSMLYIMFIFIYIYTSLGMDMFAYLRPQGFVNGFDLHFKTFSTGMFSLIRVASAEQWWALLWDCSKRKAPDFHCLDINTYDDFVEYGFNGCGTRYAYVYYIFFHLVFSLIILNLLIASVLGAYEEHVKAEESAISKYQLNDVLNLWSKYDPRGKGFINYKLFWKLSSEIAIIFGVDQQDLLDANNKKNFLKVLNVPIYENMDSNMLCYKFHDVILSLTKISVTLKYGATNLEPTDPEVIEKMDDNLFKPSYGDQQFKETPFTSGSMSSIIYIQKKIRIWRKRMQGEAIGEIGDLNKAIKQSER